MSRPTPASVRNRMPNFMMENPAGVDAVRWFERSEAHHDLARVGRASIDPPYDASWGPARLHVRMKPSTSFSAQASVFSIGSPCATLRIIFGMTA